MTSMRDHRVVTADGTTLAATEIDGDGKLLVALHGFTGAGSTILPLIERVRDGRPALVVDIVGHGGSDAPHHDEPYTMSSVVDQVLSVIGQREPGTVHVLGYSMGGRIALSMAARAPWYFASVTTLSASPGIADPVERAERWNADQELAQRLEDEGLDAFLDWWLALPMFESLISGLDESARSETRRQRLTATSAGLANSLRGTGTGSMPPVWHALSSLRSPFLALAGELDPRYVDIATRAAAAAPFGRSETVSGAGHALHMENPSKVSHLVREFLEGCDTAAH